MGSRRLSAVDWTRQSIAAVALGILLVALVPVTIGTVAYFAIGYGPNAEALTTVEGNEAITIERFDRGTAVRSGPITNNTVGVVYYPGARVNHESYVPTAASIVTERHIVVVIVDMPLNLAVLAPNRAADAMATQPAVESWNIAGHSLGGAMACRYAADNAADLDGLVLHAAYCDVDISHSDLRVLSVLGTDDGVLNADRERKHRALLPADAEIVELDGVNHAGFGAYGPQRGDTPATREPSAMRADVADVTGSWLVRPNIGTTNETTVNTTANESAKTSAIYTG